MSASGNYSGYLLVGSIILYAASLPLNCFDLDHGELFGDNRGISLLIIGALGILGGQSAAWLCWWANPALVYSWLTFKKKPVKSLIASVVASVLSLILLMIGEVMVSESGSNFAKITSYNLGYWFWVMSILMMLIANIIDIVKRRSKAETA